MARRREKKASEKEEIIEKINTIEEERITCGRNEVPTCCGTCGSQL